jgi:hypothetical protein
MHPRHSCGKCPRVTPAILALVSVASCSWRTDIDVDRAPQSTGPVAEALYADPLPTLNIVAHQDDDTLFLNPTIINDLRKDPTRRLRTLYLTEGDATYDCPDYVKGREEGDMAAYAEMLAVSNSWTEVTPTPYFVVNGSKKYMRVITLDKTNVSLAFLGIGNRGDKPPLEGGTNYLEALWTGSAPTITTLTLDGRSAVNTYTRAELIQTLQMIMADFRAAQINTLDSSKLYPYTFPWYPSDHTDHVHSALFALAASNAYAAAHTLKMHRTYNTLFEATDVSSDDSAAKNVAFLAYVPYDARICGSPLNVMCSQLTGCDDGQSIYGGFKDVHYPVGVEAGLLGTIAGPGSKCLAAATPTRGAAVGLATCDPSSALQRWSSQKDGTIRLASGGFCLTAVTPPSGQVRGVGLTADTCATNGTDQ